ncbi:transglycosylase SLT domain-containing protein [Acidithiobacillus sp.]|uniref:lytic transglycosylase domain-containing protein n=1 Tax=Acidithiobacillus sp. TaxID=1872118 RepID=UPI0025C083D1|nr:transglycosylase SLT domain-containing protein [Acidithiobacillus sp.]
MLACIAEASSAYHVPVPAIERVLTAARPAHGLPSAGTGPMGIPAQWLPVLGAYGFPVATMRKDACWGIAAGTWILAVERMYAGQGQVSGHGSFVYPSTLPSIPRRMTQWANQASAVTDVPADMILAVAAQESGFNPDAVSPVGAQGLMQFMPGTWARFGHGSPFNPKAAIFAGAAYLRHLALQLGSWPLALAGYNAGGQAVVNAGYRIPPYRETQNYVPAVLAHYRQITAGPRHGAGGGR